MSAINPASFASPSLGLQPPSGVGPGAVGVTRPTQNERRTQQPEQSTYAAPQPSQGYPPAFRQTFTAPVDRGAMLPAAFQPSGYAFGYSPFAVAPRGVTVSPGGYAPVDSFAAFAAPPEYQGLPARFPSPHGPAPGHESNDYNRQGNGISAQNDWISSFQGLSMNTR